MQSYKKFLFFESYVFCHPKKLELIILLAEKSKVRHEMLIYLDSNYSPTKF